MLEQQWQGETGKKWLRAAVFAFNLLDENMINLPVTNKLCSWNIGCVRKRLDACLQGFWAARHLWICGGRKPGETSDMKTAHFKQDEQHTASAVEVGVKNW